MGTFVHSKSAQELDSVRNGAVAVDEAGKIQAVVRDAASADDALTQALKETGWQMDNVQITRASESEFYFPGFIG